MSQPTPSDTPETDAKWEIPYASKLHRALAMADFARTLERQRDKLADALRKLLEQQNEQDRYQPLLRAQNKAKAVLATLNQPDQ